MIYILIFKKQKYFYKYIKKEKTIQNKTKHKKYIKKKKNK